MKKLNTKQIKNINDSVKAQFLEGVSENDTAKILFENGVAFSDIQNVILDTAKKLKLILSEAEVFEKVELGMKDKQKPVCFADVLLLASSLNVPQVENDILLAKVQKHFKTNLKEHKKSKMLRKDGTNHGMIASWIKDNPSFTASELHKSGVCTAPNANDYYEEFLAYKAFFESVQVQA